MAEVTSFLERVAARESSFVMLGDQLYALMRGEGRSDRVEIAGLSIDLVPSLPFGTLEALDDEVYSREIWTDCEQFVQQAIDLEVKAEKDLRGAKNRLQALDFIMFEFLPFMLSKKYTTEEYIGQMFAVGEHDGDGKRLLQTARDEIQAKLDKDFGVGRDTDDNPGERMRRAVMGKLASQLEKKPLVPQEIELKEMGIPGVLRGRLCDITAGQPLYISDGSVYQLVPAQKRPSPDEMFFTILGHRYVPGRMILGLPALLGEYAKRRNDERHLEALEHSRDMFGLIKDVIKTDGKRQQQLAELAKLSEYDLGVCGFVMLEGNYWVYSRVPKFVTQDGRDENVFWPFPSVRVAIAVGWENGKAYAYGEPHVVDRMQFHPCMYDRNGEFSKICNLNRHAGDYHNTTRDIVRKLSDAVNVVLHPMNKSSLEAHAGYTYFGVHLNDILKQGSMTREEAVAQGYYVAEVIEKRIR